MGPWLDGLPVLERVFFYVAAPATAIMLVQTVLLFFGGGGPGDTDLDSDTSGIGDHLDSRVDGGFEMDDGLPDSHAESGGDGLRFITTRGVVAFLTVAGWSGVLCAETGVPGPLSVLIASMFGFGAMVGIAVLVRSLLRLQSSGNIDYRNALGAVAQVYLTIPGGGGAGKVSLTLGGTLTECEAVTECGETIRTGASVRVTDVIQGSVLVVEPLEKADGMN